MNVNVQTVVRFLPCSLLSPIGFLLNCGHPLLRQKLRCLIITNCHVDIVNSNLYSRCYDWSKGTKHCPIAENGTRKASMDHPVRVSVVGQNTQVQQSQQETGNNTTTTMTTTSNTSSSIPYWIGPIWN